MPNLNPTEEAPPKPRMSVIKCKHCGKKNTVMVSSILGSIVTPKKTAAALKNGAKGGRPKGAPLKVLKKRMAAINRGETIVTEMEKHALARLIRRRSGGK